MFFAAFEKIFDSILVIKEITVIKRAGALGVAAVQSVSIHKIAKTPICQMSLYENYLLSFLYKSFDFVFLLLKKRQLKLFWIFIVTIKS